MRRTIVPPVIRRMVASAGATCPTSVAAASALQIAAPMHDPAFISAGAQAYRQDLPEAEIHLLDAGHFALETHHDEIAGRIRDILGRKLAI